MSYLNSSDRTRILSQIATKEAQLTAANTALTEALGTDVQSYSFDSGEGKQSTTRRKLKELQDAVRGLEAELDRLYRRINGSGLVTMNLRRVR